MEGPRALPMPHKNTPLLSRRSCSFRKRICSIGSAASVPKRVQQNRSGKLVCVGLFTIFVVCNNMHLDATGISGKSASRLHGTQASVADNGGKSGENQPVNRFARIARRN